MRFSPFALAGMMLLAAAPTSAQTSLTVVQAGRAFHPGEIVIAQGETLIFSNRDDFIHQVYVKSDSMSFDSNEQPPGQNVLVPFPAAGTFEVRCHIHPRMSLIVHVK